ncbi:MAG: class I SAM-dependent methyltransferase [Gammaproteobacteria bacterium]|nr:class I SAM-dependent methyltransferase [Gammaproteobacteria bacterium]
MEAGALVVDELKDEASNINWANADNKEFYENFSFKDYQKYLTLAGLASSPDVILIKDLILSAKSILDVGPGYGRVIEFAKNLGYQKQITAVEFSDALVTNLQKKFVDDKIIHGDFLKFATDNKFDLILMMWTTLSVFNPFDEQQACFYQCAKMLSDDGYCVIDMLLSNSAEEAITNKASQYYVTHAGNNTTHYAYGQSILEIMDYVAKAGLAIRQIKEYKAATAKRCLVILSLQG